MSIAKIQPSSQINLKAAIFCGVISALLCLLFAFVFSLICVYLLGNDSFIPVFSKISLYLSALCGGMLSCTGKKSNGLKCGISSGIVLSIILCLVSLFVPAFEMKPVFLLKIFCVCITSGAGGVVSINFMHKRKKNKIYS